MDNKNFYTQILLVFVCKSLKKHLRRQQLRPISAQQGDRIAVLGLAQSRSQRHILN